MCLSGSLGGNWVEFIWSNKMENISLGQHATKNTNTTVKTCLWGCNQILKLYPIPGSSWTLPCVQLKLAYFLFKCYLFAHNTRRHETCFCCWWKKCCTGRFKKVGQDDGELSLIPCFYIPALLPVQPSMHGWTMPTAGPIPPREAGIPGLRGTGGDPG